MLPLPANVPLFLLLLLPAWVLGVAIHELGHLIVGRLAGLDVVACGIGLRRPFWSHTWRGITFYLGRPVTSGLNLFVVEDLRWPRWQMVTMVLAGPAASVLLTLVAWLLWQLEIAPTLISALFWTAAFVALTSLVPAQIRRGPVTLSTDGMTAWRLFRNRTHVGQASPGIVLATQLDLSQTCARIDCVRGEIYMTLATAFMQASLDDGAGALETLEADCLRDSRRTGRGESLELYVRAVALEAADSPDSSLALEDLARVAHRSPELRAAVALLKLDIALNHRTAVGDLLQVAEQAVVACPRPEFLAEWHASQLVALAPDDLEAEANKLLEPTREMPQLTALRLRIEVCRLLVERGRSAEARTWFQLANTQLAAIASTITLSATRERFLASYLKRLRKIVDLTPDDSAILATLPTVDTERGENARQWAMLMTSIAALATAMILISLILGEFHVMHGAIWTAIGAGYLGLISSGRAIWLSRRMRPVMTMFLIANLALAISAAAFRSRIDRRDRSARERSHGASSHREDSNTRPHANTVADESAAPVK